MHIFPIEFIYCCNVIIYTSTKYIYCIGFILEKICGFVRYIVVSIVTFVLHLITSNNLAYFSELVTITWYINHSRIETWTSQQYFLITAVQYKCKIGYNEFDHSHHYNKLIVTYTLYNNKSIMKYLVQNSFE